MSLFSPTEKEEGEEGEKKKRERRRIDRMVQVTQAASTYSRTWLQLGWAGQAAEQRRWRISILPHQMSRGRGGCWETIKAWETGRGMQ